MIKAGKDIKLSAKADDTSILSGRSLARIAKDNDAQWEKQQVTIAVLDYFINSAIRS